MSSSVAIPFFDATPKAWCVVSHHTTAATPTRASFDEKNFVDGYNLYISPDSQTSTVGGTDLNYNGAIKFSFVTPMPNNRYKIFVNAYRSSGYLPFMCHALNSVQYPKTRDSFWVRAGYWLSGIPGVNDPPIGSGRTKNQIANIRLWSNGSGILGVYVL
jgi:hypothetical protein